MMPLAAASAATDARNDSAVSMLPDGSELQGVIIPRYNEKRKLTGMMKAKTLRLVDREQASATDVAIEFHDDTERPRGRIDLHHILYRQATGMIRADEAVKLRSARLQADGSGLHYDVHGGEGFLIGPSRTWMTASPETAMKPTTRPLRTAALLGASAITLVAGETKPAAATAAEASRATREELAQALADSQAAHDAAAGFLKKAEAVDPTQAEAAAPEAKPLDLQPGPKDLVIQCDGGMYFNPEEGVFVYLKNVTVKDPRFSLHGANELKIFLGKKPGAASDAKDAMDFGEIDRVTASGTLVFEQQPEAGGEPIRASGSFFSYHVPSDQVVLSGGFPWVVQGGIALRAREASLSLRIQPKARTFQTEGRWDTIVPLEQLQNR
jgi:lipopolysaccharide export system protein LptA